MAQFRRIQVVFAMEEAGIIPVFYHPDPETTFEVIKACYKGGLKVFEFTNRGDFAHEVFSQVNKRLAAEYPDIILGAGSIVDAGTSALYMQTGANFIVSPVLNPEMALVCNRRKILWVPGCGTLSEISEAEELGAEIVKIFPGGQVGGPEFVASIKGPMPWTSIMPTGGVEPTRENLSAWFMAGVVCVGMGSKLITNEIVKNKNHALLEEKVRQAVALLKEIRKK
ncbi:MAG TPA: bifunctional 4-hydroxy-2-oxoglutarate aldolase/2-dehydro-3-deoxy-phosphogluconate aldolase [Bacteroidales bacterium]|nr:bifunctional 4-hydroxy-2-oxoglutarate aldolase/2-dehydro-3-deoxy-phosphogluconate aldolase [Bacteroidales bacterium]